MVVILMKPKLSSIYGDTFFQAYGSVSYIRTVNKDTCHVAFVIGKSRLASLSTKGISIPTLELQPAVIAVQLKVKLIQECNLRFFSEMNLKRFKIYLQ